MTTALEESAPYAPPTTILSVVEGYRDRGWPTPFTPDVLAKANVPESLVPRTIHSLKLLGLIDDTGEPTDVLREIQRAVTDDDARRRLGDHVREVYGEVFAFVDPSTDELQRVEGAFRSFRPSGQRRRMVTLFLGLCAWAGLVPEDAPARRGLVNRDARAPQRAVVRGSASKRTIVRGSVSKRTTVRSGVAHPEAVKRGGSTEMLVPTASAYASARPPRAAGEDDLLVAIWNRLPAPGSVWPKAEREAWLAAQSAAFALVYKFGEGDAAPADPPSAAQGGGDD